MATSKKKQQQPSPNDFGLHSGQRIQQLRDEANWTQDELGAQVGFSGGAVGNWERGYSLPTAETLAALSRLFDVSIDHLAFADVPLAPRGFLKDPDALRLLEALPSLDASARKALFRFLKALHAEQAFTDLTKNL